MFSANYKKVIHIKISAWSWILRSWRLRSWWSELNLAWKLILFFQTNFSFYEWNSFPFTSETSYFNTSWWSRNQFISARTDSTQSKVGNGLHPVKGRDSSHLHSIRGAKFLQKYIHGTCIFVSSNSPQKM